MSKRKKNYPEPSLIVDKYGADAVRWLRIWISGIEYPLY